MNAEQPKNPGILEDPPLYCANHPRVETRLRCNKCGKPICIKCAKRTPVGFRCPECLHEQQSVFYTATPVDYVVAAVVGLALSGIAGFVMSYLGWFFAIFLGPIIGGIIAEAIRRAIRKRRGRWMPVVGVICVIAGALIPLISTFSGLSPILPSLSAADFWKIIWNTLLYQVNIVYAVLASITIYARLR